MYAIIYYLKDGEDRYQIYKSLDDATSKSDNTENQPSPELKA